MASILALFCDGSWCGEVAGIIEILANCIGEKSPRLSLYRLTSLLISLRAVAAIYLVVCSGLPFAAARPLEEGSPLILGLDAPRPGRTLLAVNPKAVKGQWGVTVKFPVVPVAVAMLPTGKMLAWSSYAKDRFDGDHGFTLTAIFDPKTRKVSQRKVTNTGHDMFCPGLSMDTKGRAVVTGGSSNSRTSIYEPFSNRWIAGPPMKIARGYQSSTTLSDGRTFVIGGSWSGGNANKDGEVLNVAANSWKRLPGAPVKPMLTADREGQHHADNHPWLFAWKGGWVFQAGPSKRMNWYLSNGNGATRTAGPRSTLDAMNGNAVMYDAVSGSILTLGGAQSYVQSPATALAYVVKLGAAGAKPTVTRVASMAFPRVFSNSVVLPNGKVFVSGGQRFTHAFSDTDAVMTPELWDPSTRRFTTLPNMKIPRNYHSVSLLLPDATVFTGGGGLCGSCNGNHFDGQIYKPSYLYKSDGTAALRPKLKLTNPSASKPGAILRVDSNMGIKQFSLIRLGSNTHSINTDQRRIALKPAGTFPHYRLTIPRDSGIALPGYWMLFGISGSGVPSQALIFIIRLG